MKVKERLKNFKSEASEQLANIRSGNLPLVSRVDKAIYSATFAIGTILYSASPAFAADALDALKTLVKNYYGSIMSLALGLGALLAVIAIIIWFFVPSDRGAETGKRWFVRILICIAILSSLGFIFGLIGEMTKGQSLDINSAMNVTTKP